MSSETTALSVQDQIQYAEAISKAGILPQAYRNRPADIVVALGLGQSMGLSPTESLYRINVIQGKPTASAELITANVRKAGHKLWTEKDEENVSVTCTIVRKDMPEHPISVTRDKRWAEQMGLAGKDNYRKQPMTMLTWRAITACAREACPEALYGVVYTPDEMYDMRDEQPPVEVDARVEDAAPPAVDEEPEAEGMATVRELYPDYRDRLYGPDSGMTKREANQRATENILRYTGCESMDVLAHDPNAVKWAVSMMKDVIEFTGNEEVSF